MNANLKKKSLAIVLSLSLLLAMIPMNAYAELENTSEKPFMMKGETLTIQEFELKYVTQEKDSTKAKKSKAIDEFDENVAIEYNNIVYNREDHEIRFDVNVISEQESFSIPISGSLYRSWKNNEGICSYVGDMTTANSKFKVLYFELYEDSNGSEYFGFKPFTGKPRVLLYLQYKEKLYLFETDIPEEIDSIGIPNETLNNAEEPRVDGFWFEGIIDPEMSAKCSNDYTYVPTAENPVTSVSYPVSATWVIAGQRYVYKATPRLRDCSFPDVASSTSTWQAELKMSDSYAYINDKKQESLKGGLKLTNIDMAITSGPYTRIMRGFPFFNARTIDETNLKLLTGAVTTLAGVNLVSSLAANAMVGLLDKTLASQKIEDGKAIAVRTTDGNSNAGKGFRYKVPSPYYLYDNNDYVQIQTDVKASDFGTNMTSTQKKEKSGKKTANLQISFEYYTSDGTNKTKYVCPRISQTYNCTLS